VFSGTVSHQYCYWTKSAESNTAVNGVGEPASNTEILLFGGSNWPTNTAQWGTGDGSGDNKYWKSLGGWNGGNPVYPKLYFEE
jgi:hypothetical protein